MDCKYIETLLSEIGNEAEKARSCLRDANTGKHFHRSLEMVTLHVDAIRREVASPTTRPQSMESS